MLFEHNKTRGSNGIFHTEFLSKVYSDLGNKNRSFKRQTSIDTDVFRSVSLYIFDRVLRMCKLCCSRTRVAPETGRYTKSARHWPVETSGKTVSYVKYNSLRRLASSVSLHLTFIAWKNYNRMNLHFTGLQVDAGHPERATKSRPFIWARGLQPL